MSGSVDSRITSGWSGRCHNGYNVVRKRLAVGRRRHVHTFSLAVGKHHTDYTKARQDYSVVVCISHKELGCHQIVLPCYMNQNVRS